MEQEKLRELFEAIKKDDLKSFRFVMVSNSDLNISFGRFPILSLLYLYESYNILKVYEKDLLPIRNYKREEEPYEAYKKFKSKARKAVRLFQEDECFVYPAEMLAVVDNRFLLDKNYKKLYKNDEIAFKIKKIYNLKEEYEISLDLQKITLKKKKLTFKQKLAGFCMLGLAILFSLLGGLSVALVPGIIGRGTAASPIMIGSETEFVTALKRGDKYFKLEKDITLTNSIEAKDFSGVIDGAGYSLFAGDKLAGGLVDELTGSVVNLKIIIDIKNTKIQKNYGIIAENSTGIIENCVISGMLSGKVSLDEDIHIGLFVATNGGTIKGCNSSVNVNLSNSGATNVYYSNIACVNDGTIESSISNVGEVVADTVDIAGVACINNGTIKNCENYSSLTQTSAKEWHPNVGGISCSNNGSIIGSTNNGELYAESTLETAPTGSSMYVFVGGICCNNYNEILNCENTGDVTGKGKVSTVYAAGIAATNECSEQIGAVVKNTKAEMNLIAESSTMSVYVGGIVAGNFALVEDYIFQKVVYKMSSVENCGFIGNINTDAKNAFVGGVVSRNSYAKVISNYSSITFTNSYAGEDANALSVLGAVVSITEDAITVSGEKIINGNHYVKTTESLNGLNVHYVSYYTITPLADADTNTTAYNTLEEIPEEVRR